MRQNEKNHYSWDMMHEAECARCGCKRAICDLRETEDGRFFCLDCANRIVSDCEYLYNSSQLVLEDLEILDAFEIHDGGQYAYVTVSFSFEGYAFTADHGAYREGPDWTLDPNSDVINWELA